MTARRTTAHNRALKVARELRVALENAQGDLAAARRALEVNEESFAFVCRENAQLRGRLQAREAELQSLRVGEGGIAVKNGVST